MRDRTRIKDAIENNGKYSVRITLDAREPLQRLMLELLDGYVRKGYSVKSAFLNMAYQGIDWQVGIEPVIDVVSEHVKEKPVHSVKQEKEKRAKDNNVSYTDNSKTEVEEQKKFKVSAADEAALDDILKGMYGRG